jgi:hypothetical protein
VNAFDRLDRDARRLELARLRARQRRQVPKGEPGLYIPDVLNTLFGESAPRRHRKGIMEWLLDTVGTAVKDERRKKAKAARKEANRLARRGAQEERKADKAAAREQRRQEWLTQHREELERRRLAKAAMRQCGNGG